MSLKQAPLTLYHYWRSTSSWRVRWALAHKNIPCKYVAIDLLKGESESPEHLKRNPLGYVPVLEIQGTFIAESMAILDLLEELHPEPALLPSDPIRRAQVRQLAEMINADTQPLQNMNPQFLHSDDPEKRKQWAQHWIQNGLSAYELVVKTTAGKFSVGDELSFADLCVIPQMYNARRYEVSLDSCPTLLKIESECKKLPSYLAAEPDRFQPAN